ncbi:hypothetical protein BLOT_000324 [Blomia tropicalis]|nr:hypothetical protein BLOT_000324 [Blomia tropicalis]
MIENRLSVMYNIHVTFLMLICMFSTRERWIRRADAGLVCPSPLQWLLRLTKATVTRWVSMDDRSSYRDREL